MPVKYEYEAETNILHCHVSGVLKVADAIDYFQAVSGDDALPTRFVEFVYLGEADDIDLAFSETRLMKKALNSMVDTKHPRVTIFIATNAMAYGMAHLVLAAFSDHLPMRIVRSELAARSVMKSYTDD